MSWALNAHTAAAGLGTHREAILTSPLCTGAICTDGYLPIAQRTQGRFLYLNEKVDPTAWTAANGGTRTSTARPGAVSTRTASVCFTAALALARSGVLPAS